MRRFRAVVSLVLLLGLCLSSVRSVAQVFQRIYNHGLFQQYHGLTRLNNGQIVVCGMETSATFLEGSLLWLDNCGTLLNSHRASFSNHVIFNDLAQTLDGGLIVAGSIGNAGALPSDLLLMKTDASGALQWQRVIGDPSDNEEGHSVLVAADGNIVVAGFSTSYSHGGHDFYAVKLDNSGTVLWSRTVGDLGDDWGFDMVETADGGYVIAGTRSFGPMGGADVMVTKLDAAGSVLWTQTYGGPDDEEATAVEVAQDGSLYVGGTQPNPVGDKQALLLKLDASGQQRWARRFGRTGGDVGDIDIGLRNTGLILLSGTADIPSLGMAKLGLLCLVDSSGVLLIDNLYGSSLDDELYGILVEPNGPIWACGRSQSFNSPTTAGYLMTADTTLNSCMLGFAGFNVASFALASVSGTPDSSGHAFGIWSVNWSAGNANDSLICPDLSSTGMLSGQDTACAFSDTVQFSIPPIAGANAYNWELPLGSTLISGSGTPTIRFVPGSGSDSVCVTPTLDCVVGIRQCRYLASSILNTQIQGPDSLCLGDLLTLTAQPNGGFPPFSYSWDNGSSDAGQLLQPTVNTAYSVTVTDAFGCSNSAALLVAVQPSIQVVAIEDQEIQPGESVQLAATGASAYIWTPSTGLSCTSCPEPMASPIESTRYFVTTPGGGPCVTGDSVLVRVKRLTALVIPHIFTPNGDGINDRWSIDGKNVQSIVVWIFDRWGEKVFEGLSLAPGWDGTFQGKRMPPGVYVYMIRYRLTGNDFDERLEQGSLTLIR